MKLLIVSHSAVTPVNQDLFALVQRQTGWEITLVIPSNWIDEYGRRCSVERSPNFVGDMLPIPVRKPGSIILHWYRTSFARLLRRLRPDAIYVQHEPYALATAQVFWANRRTLRRPIGFYSCQNIAKRYPPPFRWTEAFVLRAASFFFPISSAVESVFRGKGYRGRAVVLPLGLDPDVYCPSPAALDLKGALQKSPGEVLIGFVGRIVPEKGLATLLHGFATLGDLPCRLVIIGKGTFEAEFDRQAAELGVSSRVSRLGFVPHEKTPLYLAALDILVLPSETQTNWKEQFGRVVIEAMACGTPVVGSSSGEIPNLIRSTGGGLIFPEGSPAHLADALRSLISDASLRQQLAAAGRQEVVRQYALPSIAAAFVATVRSAIGVAPATSSVPEPGRALVRNS